MNSSLAPPRPSFKYIAPGLSFFSAASIAGTYAGEDTKSFRRTCSSDDPVDPDYACLIFPADGAVLPPADLARSPNFEISTFDKPWGLGKFTVNRMAGLYLELDHVHGDVTQLIGQSGSTSTCKFSSRCPWGPSRSPRLAELLRHWKSLVEVGNRSVNENGIVPSIEWFDHHRSETQLHWKDTLSPNTP